MFNCEENTHSDSDCTFTIYPLDKNFLRPEKAHLLPFPHHYSAPYQFPGPASGKMEIRHR